MLETEFSQYQEHIDNLVQTFKNSIKEYPNVGYNDRATQLSSIKKQYNQLKVDLGEWNSTAATWPPLLRTKVYSYIEKVKAEIEQLNVSFNSDITEMARHELLGDQQQESQLQNEIAADSMIENVNQSKEYGIGILNELDRQRKKMGSIAGHLSQMTGDLDRADSLLHEMQCRDRQRKYFLIAINIFLFITLIVFIYYILK